MHQGVSRKRTIPFNYTDDKEVWVVPNLSVSACWAGGTPPGGHLLVMVFGKSPKPISFEYIIYDLAKKKQGNLINDIPGAPNLAIPIRTGRDVFLHNAPRRRAMDDNNAISGIFDH